LLELKVAAWAVVTFGFESEVQCMPQQMHELRLFPVPDHHKVLQNISFAWCEVGACRARCCALSLALAPEPSPGVIGRVDGTRVSQLKLRVKPTEPARNPLIKKMIEVCYRTKSGSLFQSGCQDMGLSGHAGLENAPHVLEHTWGAFSRSARH
jgi:hypothetical protein